MYVHDDPHNREILRPTVLSSLHPSFGLADDEITLKKSHTKMPSTTSQELEPANVYLKDILDKASTQPSSAEKILPKTRLLQERKQSDLSSQASEGTVDAD